MPNLSIYVCPWNGVYIFSVTLCNYPEIQISAELMREYTSYALVWSDGYSNTVYLQSSATVVVECARGERVWVRDAVDGDRLYDDTSYDYNVFTGYLLQKY